MKQNAVMFGQKQPLPPLPRDLSGLRQPIEVTPEDVAEAATARRWGAASTAGLIAFAGFIALASGIIDHRPGLAVTGGILVVLMILSALASGGWLDSERRGVRGLLANLPIALIAFALGALVSYALVSFVIGAIVVVSRDAANIVALAVGLVAIGLYELLNFRRDRIQNYPPSSGMVWFR